MCAADPASAAQFDGPQRECQIEWLPGDDALLAALQQCGYRSQDSKGASILYLHRLHCADPPGHSSHLNLQHFCACCSRPVTLQLAHAHATSALAEPQDNRLSAGGAASAKSPGRAVKGGKRSSGQKRALAQSTDGEHAAGAETLAPVVARLRLLLQLIPALRSYDQAGIGQS